MDCPEATPCDWKGADLPFIESQLNLAGNECWHRQDPAPGLLLGLFVKSEARMLPEALAMVGMSAGSRVPIHLFEVTVSTDFEVNVQVLAQPVSAADTSRLMFSSSLRADGADPTTISRAAYETMGVRLPSSVAPMDARTPGHLVVAVLVELMHASVAVCTGIPINANIDASLAARAAYPDQAGVFLGGPAGKDIVARVMALPTTALAAAKPTQSAACKVLDDRVVRHRDCMVLLFGDDDGVGCRRCRHCQPTHARMPPCTNCTKRWYQCDACERYADNTLRKHKAPTADQIASGAEPTASLGVRVSTLPAAVKDARLKTLAAMYKRTNKVLQNALRCVSMTEEDSSDFGQVRRSLPRSHTAITAVIITIGAHRQWKRLTRCSTRRGPINCLATTRNSLRRGHRSAITGGVPHPPPRSFVTASRC
jgi:hypothetical protein